MGVADEGVALREGGVKLVATITLMSPESSTGYEETLGSTKEMGERVAR